MTHIPALASMAGDDLRTRSAQSPDAERKGRRQSARAIVVGLFVALLSAAGLTGLATPASAAGGMHYCFQHYPELGPYQHEVYLQLWYNGQWNTVTQVERRSKGCNYVTLSGWYRNYPARMLAFTQVGTYQWRGVTPYYAPAGSATYNLGTGWVKG